MHPNWFLCIVSPIFDAAHPYEVPGRSSTMKMGEFLVVVDCVGRVSLVPVFDMSYQYVICMVPIYNIFIYIYIYLRMYSLPTYLSVETSGNDAFLLFFVPFCDMCVNWMVQKNNPLSLVQCFKGECCFCHKVVGSVECRRPAMPLYCILVFTSIFIDNILHRGWAIHGDPCIPPNEKNQSVWLL